MYRRPAAASPRQAPFAPPTMTLDLATSRAASLALSDTLWFDLAGLALVLVFLVVGARGGWWWQLVRLLGLVASVAIARAFGPSTGSALANVFPGLEARAASGLGWSLVLGAGLLTVALVGRFASRDAGEPVELGLGSRVGGAAAGALSGLVLHAAILLCVAQFATPDWAAKRLEGSNSQTMMIVVERSVPGLVEVRAAETLGLHARDR